MIWKGSIQEITSSSFRYLQHLSSLLVSSRIGIKSVSIHRSKRLKSCRTYATRRIATTTTTSFAVLFVLQLQRYNYNNNINNYYCSCYCSYYTTSVGYTSSFIRSLPKRVAPSDTTTTTKIKLQQQQRLLLPSVSNRYHTTMSSKSNFITSAENNDSMDTSTKKIVVDPFCYRQFIEYYNNDSSKSTDDYTGTIFHDVTIEQMERIVNEQFNNNNNQEIQLQDGYASFCKHIFIRNTFTKSAIVNVLPITNENEHLLRSKYQARNEYELPVLIRYFPKELLLLDTTMQQLPVAKYLDIILYSHEQIVLENQARQQEDTTTDTESTSTATAVETSTTPLWHIVSIKAQDTDKELPMTPITNMRNALGKEYGGSGIPIEKEKYMECVEYWSNHATIS